MGTPISRGPDPAGDGDRAQGPNKAVVRRLVEEVVGDGRLDLLDELCTPEAAAATRRWVAPFRGAFPDVKMEIVALVAEAGVVVGHFRCSATHLGRWQGHAPTGRRFEAVDEIYFFTFHNGRIASAWGLEDNERRTAQLGLSPPQ